MSEFISFLTDNLFIQHAVIASVLSSIACGITGTFVVVKKISYIAGGIAHAVVGGLGIAYFLNFNPLIGALVFAVVAALAIGLVKLRLRQNEDTVISALWAIGMAVGLIFAYLTPGYNVNLLSFLFGNILMVTAESNLILLLLDILIVLLVLLFYKQFVYLSFDEEYTKIRGVKVESLYLLMLVIVALTVVILVQTVGLILVIALITLPSAIALMFSKSILRMIAVSMLLILIFNLVGLYVSLTLNLPTGASIILITGIGYLSAVAIKRFKVTSQFQ